MKCFGSPTTSIVRNAPPARTSFDRPPDSREAAAAFGALLYRETFAPIAKSLGFYGDTVVGLVTQTMARNERGGIVDGLERAIAAASASRAGAGEPR